MNAASSFIRPPWHSPSSCYSVLITPPTEEPITLEEAKLRAGVTWTSPDPRDALLTDFIAAARRQVEQDTWLALLTQTREVTLAPDASGLMPLPPQGAPLQSITEVTAFTPSGNRLVLEPRRLHWRPGLHRTAWQMTDWEPAWSGLTVRIVAGWPTAAALKMEEPLLVQAVGLLTAHYATLGRDLASPLAVQPVPMGYAEAIDPYRPMWVT